MPHEISFEQNTAGDFAYVGEEAWHGLGTKLPEGAGFDVWLKTAGMDYTVERAPVQFLTGDGSMRQMPSRHVFYRSDTGAPISVMGDKFKIVQPRQTLEFFADLVAGSRFTLETAAVLKGGARFFAMARYNGGAMFVDGRDEVRPYLLLASAVDGYLATVGSFTTTRVVCQNTLDMSMMDMRGEDGAEGTVKTYHSQVFDATAIKAKLGLADFVFETALENFNKLARIAMSDEAAVRYFLRVVNPKLDVQALVADADKQTAEERTAAREVNRLLAAYREAPGARPGTVWGALNAVTWREDHGRNFRDAATRIDGSQLGAGAARKRVAYQEAMALAA
jgi:phage/plasmid-like protein (TIGR03299 family)